MGSTAAVDPADDGCQGRVQQEQQQGRRQEEVGGNRLGLIGLRGTYGGGEAAVSVHGCGEFGHWKKDNSCDPKDVAAYIKKKMEQDKESDDDNTGMKYIFWVKIIKKWSHTLHSGI
jgi:hypothetical protein